MEHVALFRVFSWEAYVGLARTHLQQLLNATAIEVVRVIAWLWGEPSGERRRKPGYCARLVLHPLSRQAVACEDELGNSVTTPYTSVENPPIHLNPSSGRCLPRAMMPKCLKHKDPHLDYDAETLPDRQPQWKT